MAQLDIDKALLPKVYESPEATGVISKKPSTSACGYTIASAKR